MGLMKDELGEKTTTEFAVLRAKSYNYLTDNGDVDKRAKSIEKGIIKKLKFTDYKNCLKATQLENKISYLEKSEGSIESLRENHNEFIKNNRLILKTQQRFKSEEHNVFTEAINKIQMTIKEYNQSIQ